MRKARVISIGWLAAAALASCGGDDCTQAASKLAEQCGLATGATLPGETQIRQCDNSNGFQTLCHAQCVNNSDCNTILTSQALGNAKAMNNPFDACIGNCK